MSDQKSCHVFEGVNQPLWLPNTVTGIDFKISSTVDAWLIYLSCVGNLFLYSYFVFVCEGVAGEVGGGFFKVLLVRVPFPDVFGEQDDKIVQTSTAPSCTFVTVVAQTVTNKFLKYIFTVYHPVFRMRRLIKVPSQSPRWLVELNAFFAYVW